MTELTEDDLSLAALLCSKKDELPDDFKEAVDGIDTGRSLTEAAVRRIASAAAKMDDAAENVMVTELRAMVKEASFDKKVVLPRKHRIKGATINKKHLSRLAGKTPVNETSALLKYTLLHFHPSPSVPVHYRKSHFVAWRGDAHAEHPSLPSICVDHECDGCGAHYRTSLELVDCYVHVLFLPHSFQATVEVDQDEAGWSSRSITRYRCLVTCLLRAVAACAASRRGRVVADAASIFRSHK
jgi:hypothetical protein